MRFITIKKSLSWGARIALGTLVLSAPVRAQDASQPVAPVPKADAKPLQTKPETIGAGELRIDGKLTAILGEGVWQVEAVSWTSPRGVTVDFDDVKTKLAKVAANSLIHQRGQASRIALKTVKLGARAAIIGKNGPEGSFAAREVVLLEPLPEIEFGRPFGVNPLTGQLLTQALAAYQRGQQKRVVSLLNQALSAAQNADDKPGQVMCFQDTGTYYALTKQDDKSFAAFTRCLEFARGTAQESLALRGLGLVHLRSGEFLKAIPLFEDAVRVAANDNPLALIVNLRNLSTAYSGAERWDDTLRIMQRLFPLQEAAKQRDNATETLILTASYQAAIQPNNAHATLQQALLRLPDVLDRKKRARFLWLVACTTWELGDQNTAQIQLEKSAQLFDVAGDTKMAQAARDLPAKIRTNPQFNPFIPALTPSNGF